MCLTNILQPKVKVKTASSVVPSSSFNAKFTTDKSAVTTAKSTLTLLESASSFFLTFAVVASCFCHGGKIRQTEILDLSLARLMRTFFFFLVGKKVLQSQPFTPWCLEILAVFQSHVFVDLVNLSSFF